MRRADERDLLVVEVGSRPRDRQRLDRLRRGAQVRDEARVAGGELDAPVADGDRMHDVPRLDDVAARDLDDERLHVADGTETVVADEVGQPAGAYAGRMPELPEVEAWVRELDPLVSRAPVESARPGHIATLKTFDPPPTALEGRRSPGSSRRGKNLLFPTDDGELVLRVHLMSAGRLRYLAPGKKGPTKPMFRVSFADGGELVLTEAGKKKRAGVWLLTPEALDAELAHLGPDALDDRRSRARRRSCAASVVSSIRSSATSARSPASAARTRTRSSGEARLSPFRLSTELSDDEVAPLARAIDDDLTRALELRVRGQGRHGRLPDPRPLRRAVPALRRHAPPGRLRGAHDHVLPACQTGGRILKDRRLSRLLR